MGTFCHDDDFIIVNRIKKGDEKAFRELFEKYYKRIYGVIFGMLHDQEKAMDLSQEVFIRVFRSIGSFEFKSGFYTWLYRIALNICIDYRRKPSASADRNILFDDRIKHDSDSCEEHFPTVGSSSTSNPENELDREELREQITECMKKLPEKHREILLLRDVEGLSYDEISEIIECPKGTVMSRLFNARAQLRELLKSDCIKKDF
jgi:RNA polymerase sigma-70 factor (ECF subfamily)